MRKILLFAMLTLVNGVLHAQNDNKNLFSCVDSTKLTLDAACISNKIETNNDFVKVNQDFFIEQQDLGGNVMATLKFYPEKMLIEVIAQDIQDKNVTAALSHLGKPAAVN